MVAEKSSTPWRVSVVPAPPNVTSCGFWIGPHSRIGSESALLDLALLR
jgi:hypothetical protein